MTHYVNSSGTVTLLFWVSVLSSSKVEVTREGRIYILLGVQVKLISISRLIEKCLVSVFDM